MDCFTKREYGDDGIVGFSKCYAELCPYFRFFGFGDGAAGVVAIKADKLEGWAPRKLRHGDKKNQSPQAPNRFYPAFRNVTLLSSMRYKPIFSPLEPFASSRLEWTSPRVLLQMLQCYRGVPYSYEGYDLGATTFLPRTNFSPCNIVTL